MKLAVVLFNLGGPDSLDAVRPFLQNLFSDPAIIALPTFVRAPLARLIAERRAPVARAIYAKMGGRSPILPETQAQARALEAALQAEEYDARCFIAMRYWKPFTDECVREIEAWKPDRIALLPLYPQFSTTTTASSIKVWCDNAEGLGIPVSRACCFPWDDALVSTIAKRVAEAWARRKPGVDYRLLLSAHGLPKRTVLRGDPYQWQVEKTAEAVVEKLGIEDLDWRVSYQSRVGPLEWIGPATDAEIRCAGADGKGLIVVPVAFVSEHSETLVELDIEYRHLADASGVRDYLRVPTVGTDPDFIHGLARLVVASLSSANSVNCSKGRICPAGYSGCGYGRAEPC